MSEVFSLASVYGAPKTTVEINSQFDFLGKTTVLVGHQSISYPPIADDLVEKPIAEEEGDWLGWTANIAIGVLVTAACVVVAVAAAPAAVVMIAGCAAVGAAAATIAVAVEDYNGGKPKPRTTGEALQEVAIGLTRGAITGAVFFFAAPEGFFATVGVGMYDGFLGNFVEQCLRGKVLEPDTLEKGIEDAIVEGATCGLFWGAGKIIGKLADRFGKGVTEGSKVIENALPNVENAKINSNKLTGYALNPEHPVGRNKAKVFESALGYNQSNADDLMKQIYNKLPSSEATLGKLDQYGQRYTVDMLITGPNGNAVNVRTGWIIKVG